MVMIEKEEQLKFFLEMRSAEDKSCDNVLLHKESKDLDLRPDFGNFQSSPISKTKFSLPSSKFPPDEFLNSENEKSDYNWLLTPPGTPLIPSMEVEPQKDETSKNHMPSFHPTALKQKVINIHAEPASKRTMASKPTSIQSEILIHPKATRKPSLSGGGGSAVLRTSTPTLAKTTKPSRAASPTSQTNFSSAKSVAPLARSSTPTRVAASSSTPTARASSASKLTSRSGTPTRGPSSATDCSDLFGHSRQTPSASKSHTTLSCNSGPLRGTSPTVKSRPFKQAEIHGFSNDSVPNLKVTLDEKPISYSKEKPREPNLSSLTGRSNGNPRRQLSSPFRRGPSNGNSYCGGKLFPTMQRSHPSADDEVNPVLIGSKMVERVVNMRKLAPPERDDHQSNLGNSAPKTADSSGFGRTLSKTSLDMALRHMNITRSLPSKFRPVTNIRASSLHDDSSSLEKSGAGNAVDSPLATSNDGSSEPIVSHNSICVDGKDIEDNDFGSEEDFFITSQQGRTQKNSNPETQGYIFAATGFKRFSYAELKKATGDFSEEIGRGAGGVVYKATLPDLRVAAVKRLADAKRGEAEFLAEASTIGRLNHMHLIEMWGYCAEGKHRLLVYEFMEHGSLAKNLSSKALDCRKRFQIAVGTAKGLA